MIQKTNVDIEYIQYTEKTGIGELKEFTGSKKAGSINGVILETAHPAKFLEDVQNILKMKIEVPERLQRSLEKEKKSIILSNNFEEFKSFLLKNS